MRTGRNITGLAKNSCRQDYDLNRSNKRKNKWVTLLYESIVFDLDQSYKVQAIKNLKLYFNYSDKDIKEFIERCKKVRDVRVKKI